MEKTNEINGVRILRSFYEALFELNRDEKSRMFEAIMEYGLNGVEPNFDDADDSRILKAIWKTYLPVVNNSIARAITSVKNGTKGGSPKKYIEVNNNTSNTQNENKDITEVISMKDEPTIQSIEKVSKKAPIKATEPINEYKQHNNEVKEEIDMERDVLTELIDSLIPDSEVGFKEVIEEENEDKYSDIKELLSKDFPSINEIHSNLIIIFKNKFNSTELNEISKEILKYRKDMDIVEYLESKLNSIITVE